MIKRDLRNAVIIVLVLAAVVVAYNQFTPKSRMPDWFVVQEGPVAHGVDKFYRAVHIKGNLSTEGDLSVDGDVQLGSRTSISSTQLAVTYGLVISPTTSHIRLSNTAAITNASLISGTTAGQLLYLTGVNVSGTITVAEGSNHWGGDLGFTDQAYDSATLLWDGMRWILTSWHDN